MADGQLASTETPDGAGPLQVLTERGIGPAITRFLARRPRWIAGAWTCVLLLWALTLPIAWLTWWIVLPVIWHWAGTSMIRGAAALFASLFLLCAPIWWGMIATAVTRIIAGATLSEDAAKLAEARDRVRATEDDAIAKLEKTDEAQLLPLLRYSRAQLDAYYVMGLGQTRRSFVNAAIAMWLGFLILIAGIILHIAPLHVLFPALQGQSASWPPGDFSTLVLASAVIIELISALFLWVYRSTIGQLTFYYRLQMQNHTAILCFRIASTMKDADEAKQEIILKLLNSALTPERPAPGSARGLAGLGRPSM